MSIKETGQLVSLIVRRLGNEKFEIISGHRRKSALESIGEKYAECDIIEMTDEQAYKALMVTNIQAQTLTEIEEADGIKHMMDSFEWTQERAAKEFGKSQNWINMRLGLLQLAEPVKEMIIARAINTSQARYINNLPEEKQEQVATRVVEEKLSSRETAELVKVINNPREETESNFGLSENEGEHDIVPDGFVPNTDEDTFEETNHQIDDQLNQPKIREISREQKTEFEIYTKFDEGREGSTVEVPNGNKSLTGTYQERKEAADVLLKIQLAMVDMSNPYYPDKLVELNMDGEALKLMDKLENSMMWLKQKIANARKSLDGESTNGSIVEFRKKEA